MSKIVRKLRVERGWTQEHLSQLTGLSVRSIQRIERGQACSLETQNALAAVLEIERSVFNPAESSTNESAPPSADLPTVMFANHLKGLLRHAYLFSVFAAVGFVMGSGRPALVWCLIGWSIGLLAHGVTAFGFRIIPGSDWERGASKTALRRFVQYGRDSMKMLARISGSASLLAGVVLLAWVSYDATNIVQSLGLQDRTDEATVALTTLLVGAILVASGIYIWRRILWQSNSNAA